MANEKIFYDLATDQAFREDGSALANDNVPILRYKQIKTIEYQILASQSKDGNDDFDDFDTSLAGKNITATAAVDNDAWIYDDGAVVTPIVAGSPITTVKLSGIDSTLLRECGRIKFTNSTSQTDTLYYNGYAADGTNYVFTLSNSSYVVGAQTPTYAYILGDDARVLQNPIVKDIAVDVTDMATGKYIITLDCNNIVYQSLIHGSKELDNCALELTVHEADDDEDLYVQEIDVRCLYKMDDDGDVAPAPADNYYTKTESDARFAGLAGAVDIEITDATKGFIIKDRTTGTRYRLAMVNGEPGWEPVA